MPWFDEGSIRAGPRPAKVTDSRASDMAHFVFSLEALVDLKDWWRDPIIISSAKTQLRTYEVPTQFEVGD